MTALSPRLQMQNIKKSFGPVQVLNGVSMDVMPGEIVALLGSNGAGKSTLMKILTANYSKNAGDIRVNDQLVDFQTPRDASRVGIRFLPQEISVFPELTIAENICMSAESTGPVNWSDMASRAELVLDDLGFGQLDPQTLVNDLPVAERRIIEIARALEGQADILVMDEPTASLSEQESEQIFIILRRLKERGTSIVYISHYLKEVFEISDRIVVLRDGLNSGEFDPHKAEVSEVVSAMLGKVSGSMFEDRPPLPEQSDVVLSCSGLTQPGVIENVCFELRTGEIMGVFGLIGSGVEVLGRLIFGAEGRPEAGSLMLNGAAYTPISPLKGKQAGIGFVTAERKTDGIMADMSVRENLVAAFQADFGGKMLTSPARENEHTTDWIDRLGIKTAGPEQAIRFLSGGNQQKVCVARWLNPKVKVLILEEPTRGVDVGARKDIYRQLVAFAREGLAILVLSSDVEEIAGLSDRSMVIDRGRIIETFEAGAAPSDLMSASAQPS
ncbi:sugar ABC transporter ATP-binding protein [Yoonia sediminilitoris]|uniref:Ribose transport system ATP-binding protein n=1 Tax=Yoonia sediminilitoris TaxID=1286148 RepID=A0A2T6K6R2_9RHOB|nr:sugar ABC transporter ATP-binding protein [Yoonia sediminilitoris]PUB10378.1 ribose transport system ATP-binding protein [Yoonia sediminilitoris]RCW89844.1 ribose transport system ATP-binding protein [Yoonia sediminilitoris]